MLKIILSCYLVFFLSIKCFTQNIFPHQSNNYKGSDSVVVQWYDNPTSINGVASTNIIDYNLPYRNIGAIYEMIYNKSDLFNLGYDVFKLYNVDQKIFNLNMESSYFSKLEYQIGSRKEQIFSISHQQKLIKGLFASIFYKGLASPGFYKRQSNNIKNFGSHLNFSSTNKNYNSDIYYFNNKYYTEENGGILNDSLLKFYSGQESAIAINLNESERKISDKELEWNQSYDFYKESFTDTMKLNDFQRKFIGFENKFRRSKYDINYNDSESDSSYFLNNYISQVGSKDTLSMMKVSNEFIFSIRDFLISKNKGLFVNFNLGYETEFYKVVQHVIDKSFNNQSANISMGFNNDKWTFISLYKKLLDKNVDEAYFSESKFYYKTGNIISKVGVTYKNQSLLPDYVTEIYYSNHYIWSNNFENTKEHNYSVFANLLRDNLSVSYSNKTYKNYIFYAEQSQSPDQYSSDIKIENVCLDMKYQLANWHLQSNSLANISASNSIIKFPKLILTNSIYYKNYFFKKALLASIGFQCHYQSAYFANAFNPSTGQFYIQNKVKIGDYPFIDFFLNMKIKTATVFLKVEHLNAGIGERNYFYMPHYPTPGRTLKFGINWIFKD